MLPCGHVWLSEHVFPYAAFVSLYGDDKKINKSWNKRNGPNGPEGSWPQKGIPLKFTFAWLLCKRYTSTKQSCFSSLKCVISVGF